MRLPSAVNRHALLSLSALAAHAAPATPPASDGNLQSPEATGNVVDLHGLADPAPSLNITRKGMKPYYYGCLPFQKAVIEAAWLQAGDLAAAHAKWSPNGAWQDAMTYYMGPSSKFDRTSAFTTGQIQSNIDRQLGIHHHNQKWSPYWSYAYFYCDESLVPKKKVPQAPEFSCDNPGPAKNTMYTFPDNGSKFGWTANYVVFCPEFYSQRFNDLNDALAFSRTNPDLEDNISLYYVTRAVMLLAATYIWKDVRKPGDIIRPPISNPDQLVSLARERDTPVTSHNPHSYAIAAAAMYAQQVLGLPNVPRPLPFPPQPPANTISAPIPVNFTLPANVTDLPVLALDTPPVWFVPAVAQAASSFEPDLKDPNLTVGDGGAGDVLADTDAGNVVSTS